MELVDLVELAVKFVFIPMLTTAPVALFHSKNIP
jgi:hypothetical protein